ncbi:sestrin-3-like isoform X1 [Polyodon spathula]|uniref:sestrin-3-like isoform X1 n=1 Tax=Polyodon spathula TaxID=7913 RepID=UPI001B7E7B9B|nr:sestrin-3-like isoform X1 [Polyodon spathula]
MIICGKNMDFPLGNQCQRLQTQVVKVSSEKERPQLLFVKALASRGRLDSVTQQMGYHPQYLDSFLRTQHYILHMDGPLPFHYRHYIAIMAAARHHCRYLVSLHSAQFLRVGGNPAWLQGLDSAPQRLRNLHEINKVLAHRPWLVAREHIESLLKIGEQCWSMAELVQAVVLLAHCHALASFVFGVGIEQDPPVPGTPGNPNLGSYCFCDTANGNAACTPENLRSHRRRSLDSSCEAGALRDRTQRLQGEKERRGERKITAQGDQEEDLEEKPPRPTDLSCFLSDPEFRYQEFTRRNEDHFQVFRVQDYSWEDHGFSLVNRLYSDIGYLLDERFRTVTSLQNGLLGEGQSSDLKRAIWNYIHCMFGISYDDYDYGEVNHLLERSLKLYIKTVTCHPEKTKPQLLHCCWKQLKQAEKVHVNLLIMEARMQAELLYALRAITQHMTA